MCTCGKTGPDFKGTVSWGILNVSFIITWGTFLEIVEETWEDQKVTGFGGKPLMLWRASWTSLQPCVGRNHRGGLVPSRRFRKNTHRVGRRAIGNAGHTLHRVGASTVSSSTGLSSSPISRKATPMINKFVSNILIQSRFTKFFSSLFWKIRHLWTCFNKSVFKYSLTYIIH